MGTGELGEGGNKECGVPSGACEFTTHGSLGGFELGEIEGEATQKGQVFWAVVLAVSRLIFVHNHVEYPVEIILDAPVAADDGIKAFWIKSLAEQVVAGLVVGLAVDLACRRHFAGGLETRPRPHWCQDQP